MKQSANVEGLPCAVRAISCFVVVLSLIVLSLSAAVVAQELAATLTGTVSDATGAVVPGAIVIVHNDETGADVRNVTTSNTGNFNITNVPAGRYTVTVKNQKVSKPLWPRTSS